MAWEIELYKDRSGKEPMAEFLDDLFLKKTDKTPEREIELAEKRMRDFIERYGGKS